LTTGSLTQAYTTGLFVEVNATATGLQGFYRFDPPDTAFATGANIRSCAIGIGGAANMAPLPLEIELTAWNNQDGVTGGMTGISSTGTLGSVSNVRGTATVILAAGTHAGAVVPIVQTASLAMAVGTASSVGAVAVVDTVRTSTVTDFTAGALGRFFNMDAGTFDTSSANSVVRQITTNAGGGSLTAAAVATAVWAPFGTGTVMLWSGTHSGAVVPVVQTASVALTANAVGTASGIPPVTLSTGTHTGAVIPTVNITQTSGDKTGYTLTAAQHLLIASAVGTASQAESYRGSGAGASLAQLGYEAIAHLGEHTITSTTTVASKNLFKVDGTSSAARFAIQVDTSTLPTGISHA
jgi:hypothetical protein